MIINENMTKILIIFILDISLIVIILIKKMIRSKIRVCLCAIIKDENKYIIHFIEHYKNLGYDHMYIYDNNDINGENVKKVIKKLFK